MTAIGHFFAGRYSDAALWAEKAVREQPSLITLRVAAASYASAGRSEDAHQAIARALQFDPDMRVSNLKDRLMQFRPEHFAKYADACNLYAFENLEVIRAKLEILRRYCDNIGRPFEEIERSAIGSIDLREGKMSARETIDYCRRVNQAGIQHFIVSMPEDHELKPIELMGKEVIPAVAEL